MVNLITGPHGHHRDLRVDGTLRMPVRWGWWKQWRREAGCFKELGHCWHGSQNSWTYWDCCECGAIDEVYHGNRCTWCVDEALGRY